MYEPLSEISEITKHSDKRDSHPVILATSRDRWPEGLT